ncbi:MAG: hypothetical protein AAF368_02400 [Planctomycetota bacterium]
MFSALPLFALLPFALPLPQDLRTESAQTGPPIGLQSGGGASVVATADQLILGAPKTPFGADSAAGLVLIYSQSGSNWVTGQNLVSPDPVTNGHFGAVLALGGDRLVVGEPGGTGQVAGSGTVSLYVFNGMTSSWQFETQLFASDGAPGDEFGTCVSIDPSGERIAVGSPNAVGGSFGQGAVYVYELQTGSWTLDGKLGAPLDAINADFATSVAITESAGVPTVLIGCPGYDTGLANSGSVFAWERPTPASWNPTQEVQAAAPELSGRFGVSVAAEGEFALVGMPRSDLTATDAGAVVALDRAVTGFWSPGQVLLAFDGALDELFGSSLHLRGNRALVGAREERRGVFLEMGAAYAFERSGPGLAWQSRAKLIASDASPGDQLGTSVHVGENFYASGAGAPFLGNGRGYTFGFEEDYRAFCFGDLDGSTGCTPCPCANAAPAGTFGGCLHSAGSSARLLAFGSPSAAADTARFEVQSAPPGSFALLQSAASPLPLPGGPCPPGSGIQSTTLDGLRCIGNGAVRMGVRPTDAQGNVGVTNSGWGGNDAPAGGILAKGAFVAGQSAYFQVFFRDAPGFPCDQGLDTTNAIEMIVRP